MKLSYAMLIALLWPQILMGQRGASYEHNSATPNNFMSDYPGFFDTNIPPNKGFALDLPSGSTDFGVNDSLSLGINAFSLLATASNFQFPILIIKARYRLYSSENFSTAITVYPGFYSAQTEFLAPQSGEKITGKSISLFQMATWNSTWHLYQSNVTLTVIEMSLSTSDTYENSARNSTDFVSIGAAGVSYQYYMGGFFGPQMTLGSTLWQNQKATTSSATSVSDAKLDRSGAFARLCLDFKIFARVILSPIVLVTPKIKGSTGYNYTPFATVEFKW